MFWDVRGRRLSRASLFALFRRIDFFFFFFSGLFMGRSVSKEPHRFLIFGAPEEQRSVSSRENKIRLIKIMKESLTLAKRIGLFRAKFYCTFSFMVTLGHAMLGPLMLAAVLKYEEVAMLRIRAQTPVVLSFAR